MRSIHVLILFIMLFAMRSARALDKLPGDIYLKNPEQGFSYECLYALKDGKIWIKPNTRNTGITGEWTLFNKTGVPYGKRAKSFGENDRAETVFCLIL